MNCRETRQYLFAFLDSELDAALSVELQCHLDSCCACAREAEIERMIGRRLRSSGLGLPIGADPFDEDEVRKMLRERTEPRRRERVGKRSRVVATVCLVAALAGAGAVGLWVTVAPASDSFAQTLVRDLRHVASDPGRLDLISSDAARIESWIREATDWEVRLPIGSTEDERILGARLCELFGSRVPLVLYRMNGELASLVILPSEAARVHEMRPTPTGFIDRCDGSTVIAAPKGGLTWIAAGECDKGDLERLVALADARGGSE